jgi:hypothetical protein
VPDQAVTVEALDARGQVVGTGRLVPLDRPTGQLYAWN